MDTVFVELFTTSMFTSEEEGRTLVRMLDEHIPSWMPHRYGWSEPPRHVYSPEKFDHFWKNVDMLSWRNASRTAAGRPFLRRGPRDILSDIALSGEQTPELDLDALAGFLHGCGRTLDLTYAVLHPFHPEEAEDYDRESFRIQRDTPILAVGQGTLARFLPDLFWGNIFGPPYVQLFGADRLRTAPAAQVLDVAPDCYYLQLTDNIRDVQHNRPAIAAARAAVKAHLGDDCFYVKDATTPRRAPHFRTSAELGLWTPPPGFDVPEHLRRLMPRETGGGQ